MYCSILFPKLSGLGIVLFVSVPTLNCVVLVLQYLDNVYWSMAVYGGTGELLPVFEQNTVYSTQLSLTVFQYTYRRRHPSRKNKA
jgi:hypothetical protein